MKVKRIFAPDMRQAMKRVRDEIGPEAIIVSNHRIAGGVEVVAAHEQDFEHAQSQFKKDSGQKKRRESQIDLLTQRERATSDTHRLEDEKLKARNRVLHAQSRAVSEYDSNDIDAGSLRNKQVNSNYDDDLEVILASLKKKKDGRRQRGAVADVAPSEPVVEKSFEQELERDTARYTENVERTAVPDRSLSIVHKDNRQTGYEDDADNGLIEDMQQEIAQLKKMLASQLPGAYEPRKESSTNNLVVDKLAKRFEQIGLTSLFETNIARQVDPGMDMNKAWRKALAKLVELVPVVKEDFIHRSGMIAFVGPTGVGKTTTIGKLAAKYVLENGSAGVALVTTDSYRIAAHEQLKTYGRILDIPVRVVDERNSLSDVLTSLQNKRLVLIDTAGLGAGDAATHEQNLMLENVPMRLKKLLVLSCSSQKQVLDDAYDNYHPLGLNGCVLTKVDESGSMGAALELVTQRGLPVAYVTSGQKVPDDIEVAQKNDLVSRAVLTAQKSREREKIRRNASI